MPRGIPDPPDANLDTINMVQIPSRNRSLAIINLANNLGLSDPFRILHPIKRDFTYIPNARINLNRSRIDFFLMSKELSESLIDCKVAPALSSTSFDHKKISLTLGKRCKKKDFNKIDDNLLNKKEIELLVKIKVLESYLIHADPDSVPGFFVNNLLIDIGRVETYLRQSIKQDANNPDLDMAEAIFETMPELEIFHNLPLSCSEDFFFDGLVSVVKTSLLSLQANIHLEKNKTVNNLKLNLQNLKQNFGLNCNEIFNLERSLSEIQENQLKEELANYKIFDRLNNEKITPYFMKLVRSNNSEADLSVIKKGDGTVFNSEVERGEYITDFYSDLYKKPPNNNNISQQELLNFLGPVCESEQVTNSKITDNEKTSLDRPLHISEFDKAIRQANKKSAPGTDGISNKFIHKFWRYLRVPLLNYANCCYEKGELTPLFKTAKIRLIPKKGNKTQIGNWRPISLLNCFYKIISRVLTNRLKSVTDKITKVGQYGYSTKKQCQEVLLGLITKYTKLIKTIVSVSSFR
jgi:Reverse transcriptase (RNA-dependent DNA polymerase)